MSEADEYALFKKTANQIVGEWKYYNKDWKLCFSLCQSKKESATLELMTQEETFSGLYAITIHPNENVELFIEGLPCLSRSLLKILTDDTLILLSQVGNAIILQRKPDLLYANQLIRSVL